MVVPVAWDESHVCEPTHYNAPVGEHWRCPGCGQDHVSRPIEELPQRVKQLPGLAEAIGGIATTYWQGVHDG